MTAIPFEDIVREHGDVVLRVCRAALGPSDAEDAWSETFLAAMRAYPDLPPASNVQAWLVTIAKRKAVDAHRQRQRRPVPVEELPPGRQHEVVDPSTSSHDLDELWTALRALPQKQREAVAYHHLGGLSYAEVGAVLGNSEAAARRAAADGMRTLRATYSRDRDLP